jgi:hypothetical protein
MPPDNQELRMEVEAVMVTALDVIAKIAAEPNEARRREMAAAATLNFARLRESL